MHKNMPEDTKREMTPAQHWNKISELVRTIQVQAKDLEDSVNDLKKDSFKFNV